MRKIFYVVGIMIMVIACFYPFYQVNNSVTMDEIQDVLNSYINNESWEQKDKQFIRKHYQLESEDYQDLLIYASPSAMEVDEITVIKSENVKKIHNSFSQRVETQLNNFRGYGISQCELLNHAVILEKGNYIILIVSANADQINKDLQTLFKKS